jgi:hypothetical protein
VARQLAQSFARLEPELDAAIPEHLAALPAVHFALTSSDANSG